LPFLPVYFLSDLIIWEGGGFPPLTPNKTKRCMKRIKIGDWVEALIYVITFGFGKRIALWVAKTFFNSDSCGCCERKQWLNRLTNPQYDGECNGVKLF